MGTTRMWGVLFVAGFFALLDAALLHLLCIDLGLLAPPFNLAPLYRTLLVMGTLFPALATVARPRILFPPSILFVFVLFTMTGGHFGSAWGIGTDECWSTQYGWPAGYVTMRHHRGHSRSPVTDRWIPYVEHKLDLDWGKGLLVLATSVGGAVLLAGLGNIIATRRGLFPASGGSRARDRATAPPR